MSGEAQRENRQKGPDSGGPGVLDGGADDLDCRTSNVHLENCSCRFSHNLIQLLSI